MCLIFVFNLEFLERERKKRKQSTLTINTDYRKLAIDGRTSRTVKK